MKKFVFLTLLTLTAGFISVGCNKSSSTCSSTSTSAQCTIADPGAADAALLAINFADSLFYDPNTSSWTTIPASGLSAGTIATAVPVYSSYLSLGQTEATNDVLLAGAQKAAAASSHNAIPYLEFTANAGVTYLFRYQKYSTDGVLLVDFQGTVPVSSSRAVLPLLNSSFNNAYYDITATIGTRYKNVISITAENNKKAGSVYQVSYQSIFSVENIDFNLAYSKAMSKFSLNNRWSFYNNSTNTGPNTNFDFFTLQDKIDAPTTVPVDARVVFYAPPVLQMSEQIFAEIPFEAALFQVSGTVVPDRGNSFLVATVPMDSTKDFGMNITLGGVALTQNSLAYTALALPAGKTFDIDFAYNLTPNLSYGSQVGGGDPFSNGLLYPLKPVCYELKNQTYVPWVKEPLRDAAIAAGNYFGICDLDQTAEINPGTTSPSSIDTWHNFFSYAPLRANKNELGHLFGIQSVTFTMTACLKVQVKASTDTNWNTKTVGGSNCGYSTADNSWTFVTAQKTFTIFDDTSTYGSAQDLNSVISRFKSSSTITYPTLKINNENLNGSSIRHIY